MVAKKRKDGMDVVVVVVNDNNEEEVTTRGLLREELALALYGKVGNIVELPFDEIQEERLIIKETYLDLSIHFMPILGLKVVRKPL